MRECTLLRRWQASNFSLRSRRRIYFVRLTGRCPLQYVSPKPGRYEPGFMRGTRRWRRLTSIACCAARTVPHFSLGMPTAARGVLISLCSGLRQRTFVGEHDFQSFAASDPDLAQRGAAASTRIGDQEKLDAGTKGFDDPTIFSSEWEERAVESVELLVYRVRGDGFLHHMVRNVVGTMIDVGRGFLQFEEIPKILAARSRSAAGPTAPARGLFLVSVEYAPEED